MINVHIAGYWDGSEFKNILYRLSTLEESRVIHIVWSRSLATSLRK
jgi:hypothetical protein